MSARHFCYVLVNSSRRNTYVGYTVNPMRRLRQHNGELTGGAKYTSAHGPGWQFALILTSPSESWTHKKALSLEYHMKPHGKKMGRAQGDPMLRRIELLKTSLVHAKFIDYSFNLFVSPTYESSIKSELIDFENRLRYMESIAELMNPDPGGGDPH